jgi:hypothetical protein
VDGSGLMIANSTNPATETWSWEVCLRDLSYCAPFATGQTVSTNGAPARTKFRATSSLGAVALTPAWNGNAKPVSAPSATGRIRANELVTPVPGAWAGGWDGGVHITQLAACTDRAGTECIVIADRSYVGGCPDGAAVIDPAFTGDYLRVADNFYGPDPISPGVAVGRYHAERDLANPTTSVAIVGRIALATGPRTETCGPGEHKPVRIDRHGAAIAQCLRPCSVTLTARGEDEFLRRGRDLPSLRSAKLSFRPRALIRLEGHRVRITAEVDGERVARRTIRTHAR